MGAMKISLGPRYQRTGSPRQKKARQFAELAEKVFAKAIVPAGRQTPQRQSEQLSQREKI